MAVTNREVLSFIDPFIRSLFHRIRTPLSVVSNDLYYLKNKLNDDDCSRAIEKCMAVSTILKEFERLLTIDTKENFDLIELLHSLEITIEKEESRLRVIGSKDLYQIIFDELNRQHEFSLSNIFYDKDQAELIFTPKKKDAQEFRFCFEVAE